MNRAVLHRTHRLVAAMATCLVLATGCDNEPPPHTVVEFLDNPRLLEATMVRCAANRAELRYNPECMNAREAVDRISAAEEADRRKQLEAQSVRKREALRRAQQAAAEARARAAEAERQRRETEYLSQFDELPPADGDTTVGESFPEPPAANAPANTNAPAYETTADSPAPAAPDVEEPPPAGARTFPHEQAPVDAPASNDLSTVRDELRRRAQPEQPGQPDQPGQPGQPDAR